MTNQASGNARGPRPYWIPAGVDFDHLPDGLRTAIIEVVNPAYRELVLGARGGLEKSTGLTIVSLLWRELLDQIEMSQDLTDPRSVLAPSEDRSDSIDRHLRLVGAKIKASNFFLRLQEFRQKWGRSIDRELAEAQPVNPPNASATDTEGL